MNEMAEMTGQRLSSLALCAALVVATPAAALDGLEPTTRWDPKLDELESRLEAGKYSSAQRALRSLRERMVREAASFEANPRTLARATALLAVAEAGLANHEAAEWHWHAAHALDRRAVPGDLGRFGVAGAWLIERPPRRAGDLPGPPPGEAPDDPAMRPARRAEAVQRPTGMCGLLRHTRDRVPPPVVIEVLVDDEGRPHDPVLMVPTRFAGFAAAALDSVRYWRFEPARSADDDPVATLAQVRVEHPRN
jgi:hypothetical protein